MKKLNSYLAQKQEYLSKEMSSSNFIPYSLHCNEDTVLLKDNSLLKIIKIKGFAFETADDDDIDIKNALLGKASQTTTEENKEDEILDIPKTNPQQNKKDYDVL